MADFVIVGGGSAGCVLANRLSADPRVSVTLLEAGPGDGTDLFRLPIAGGQFFKTRYDWDLDTHPERACGQRRIYLPQARVLGGGSSINGMAYIRGHARDYDEWGSPPWRFEDLLPYFRRAEDNERGEDFYHGVGGPLRVSDSRANNPSAHAFLAAALNQGYPATPDFNGRQQLGFGTFQVTQRDGQRASAATEYLRPALERENLTVELHMEAHRIVIENGRAVGVEASRGDDLVLVRAEREVIVCAGTYQSPKLLMLSGIGPEKALSGHGIPTIVDQPHVGQNLQDHPHVWLSYAHDEPVSLLAAGAPEHQEQYAASRTGLMTSGGPETGGFVSTTSTDVPDLQFLSLAMPVTDQFLSPPAGHGLSFGASILRPTARGHVELFSADPTAKPRIQQNYLAEEADMELAVDGLRRGLELAGDPALRTYTPRSVATPLSPRKRDLREFARRNVVSGHHPVGTCAIGTVVDAELRVQGVDAVRVVDASVIPLIVRGNTMAPVIAIAERAADLLIAA